MAEEVLFQVIETMRNDIKKKLCETEEKIELTEKVLKLLKPKKSELKKKLKQKSAELKAYLESMKRLEITELVNNHQKFKLSAKGFIEAKESFETKAENFIPSKEIEHID